MSVRAIVASACPSPLNDCPHIDYQGTLLISINRCVEAHCHSDGRRGCFCDEGDSFGDTFHSPTCLEPLPLMSRHSRSAPFSHYRHGGDMVHARPLGRGQSLNWAHISVQTSPRRHLLQALTARPAPYSLSCELHRSLVTLPSFRYSGPRTVEIRKFPPLLNHIIVTVVIVISL